MVGALAFFLQACSGTWWDPYQWLSNSSKSCLSSLLYPRNSIFWRCSFQHACLPTSKDFHIKYRRLWNYSFGTPNGLSPGLTLVSRGFPCRSSSVCTGILLILSLWKSTTVLWSTTDALWSVTGMPSLPCETGKSLCVTFVLYSHSSGWKLLLSCHLTSQKGGVKESCSWSISPSIEEVTWSKPLLYLTIFPFCLFIIYFDRLPFQWTSFKRTN